MLDSPADKRRRKGNATGAVCTAVTILAAVSPWPGSAQAATMEGGGVTNHSDNTYIDFHVTLTSLSPFTVGGAALAESVGGLAAPPEIVGNGTTIVKIDWGGLMVEPGDSIGWCAVWSGHDGYVFVDERWTMGTRRAGVASPVLGSILLDSGAASLTNSYAQVLEYSNLEYTVQATPIADTPEQLAQLMLVIAEGTPFDPPWTPLPDGSIAPNGQTLVVNANISPGEFLITYCRTNFASDPNDIVHVMQSSEHPFSDPPVPAIGRVGVIVLGLMLLLCGLVILARRDRPAARADAGGSYSSRSLGG